MGSDGEDKKWAIVTGAASGIGSAIAHRMAREGFGVAVVDIDPAGAKTTAGHLQTSGFSAIAVEADMSKEDSVRSMVATVLEAAGQVDALINNAGVAGDAKPAWELPDGEWERVLSINLSGVYFASRAVLPHMISRASGRIVNVASIAGKEGNPNAVPYSASKAGVIGLTKAIAKEVVTRGVLVNCVTPAVIETPLLDQLTEEQVAYMVSRIPMGRLGQPSEVAALVAWLCSDECSFSTGAVFDISGGRATY